MGLHLVFREARFHGVRGAGAAAERLRLNLAARIPCSTEVCPVCSGFCAQCRIWFQPGEAFYWWRVLPMHPECGRWGTSELKELSFWQPPYECFVDLCAQVCGQQAAVSEREGDEQPR